MILTEKTFTNTNYNNFYKNNGENYIAGSHKLLLDAKNLADKLGMTYRIGDTLCSDTFYSDEDEVAKARRHNLLGVEMESAALYINAEKLGKDALTICTVSNNLITKEETTADERQNSFVDMIKLALELA